MLDQYIGEYVVSIININNGIKETYLWVSKLFYQPNFDIGWVSQGERMSVHLSYYLG
jgi:hypothetical protein